MNINFLLVKDLGKVVLFDWNCIESVSFGCFFVFLFLFVNWNNLKMFMFVVFVFDIKGKVRVLKFLDWVVIFCMVFFEL